MFTPLAEPLQAFVRKKGLFSFLEDGHGECCGIRKIEPLKRALRPFRAWATGQRRDQSPTRSRRQGARGRRRTSRARAGRLLKLNPLAGWSSARVWEYIREQRVPYNALHDHGFVSIGCQPCTRPLRPGEHERAARWWWEEATQRECGLHLKNRADLGQRAGGGRRRSVFRRDFRAASTASEWVAERWPTQKNLPLAVSGATPIALPAPFTAIRALRSHLVRPGGCRGIDPRSEKSPWTLRRSSVYLGFPSCRTVQRSRCDGSLRAPAGEFPRMSVSNFAHRFRLATLLWAACLAAAVLPGCTPQPTNLQRDGDVSGGITSFGQAGASATGGTAGAGGNVLNPSGAGGSSEGQNVVGGLNGQGGTPGGGVQLGNDDASCSTGFPPQEDASYEASGQRLRTLPVSNPDADAMFGQLQLTEKQTLLSGYENYDYNNGTAFEAAPLPRVNYPTFRMRDGPRGVRGVVGEQATTFPVAEVRAASFDIELEQRIGAVFATEMRAHRVDLLLAPTINVLRHPAWARAQETYGEDPVLLGEMGAAFVRGLQAGPQGMPACVKHFAGNNTDENRGGNNQRGVNAIVDEQNLRENYPRAFQIVIEKSDPACIMAAYNDVNGEPSTENSHLLTDILRKAPSDPERGFGWRGFVVSDWGATLGAGHGQLALNAGLDLEMPNPAAFGELGSANISNIDLAARRILLARASFGQLSAAYVQAHGQPQDSGIVNDAGHRALTREAAEKGAVLLKNDGMLPLGKSIGALGTPALQSIVFLGPDANIPRTRAARRWTARASATGAAARPSRPTSCRS